MKKKLAGPIQRIQRRGRQPAPTTISSGPAYENTVQWKLSRKNTSKG